MTTNPSPRSEPTYQDALRGVQNREYCASWEWREKQGLAALSRGGAHPRLVEFEKKLCKKMRHFNVPMFAERYWGPDSVDIIHCTYGWNIPEKAWAIFGHLGQEVAATIRADKVVENGVVVQITRYTFKWGGDMSRYAPSYWKMIPCIETLNAVPVTYNETGA